MTSQLLPNSPRVSSSPNKLSLRSQDYILDLIHRPRRLRRTEKLRALVRETRLSAEDFILPLFACAGENVRREIPSMPGVHNLRLTKSRERLPPPAHSALRESFCLACPRPRMNLDLAYIDKGVVQQAVRAIRESAGAGDHDGHLPLRIHVAWTLRRGQ